MRDIHKQIIDAEALAYAKVADAERELKDLTQARRRAQKVERQGKALVLKLSREWLAASDRVRNSLPKAA